MSRLPIPGQDKGTWGDVLNDFLSQTLNADGTLKTGVVTAAKLDSPTQANLAKAGTSVQIGGDLSGNPGTPSVSSIQGTSVSASTPTSGQVLQFTNGSWAPGTVTQTVVSDATATTKGIVQLTGDLGGSASMPTVPGLSTKLDTSVAASTYLKQSDATSTYAPKASPTFTGTVTVPAPSNTTDAATKAYVDSAVTNGAVADATTTAKGKIQLAGDLAGTAAAPTVAKLGGITLPGSAPTNGQVLTATSGTATSWSTPASAPVTSVAGRTGAVVIAESDVTNLTTDLAAKATDAAVVHLAGAETVSGAKTFTGTTVVPTPTANTHAATKAYVDSAVSTGTGAVSTLVLNPTATKTANYTAAAQDLVLASAASAAFTVTLPSAPADATLVEVKKLDSSVNTVTVACGGSDSFSIGDTSLLLQVPGHGVTFRYQASTTKWIALSNDVPVQSVAMGVTKTVSAAYTILTTDHVILADATTAAFTVTLPTAVGYFGIFTVTGIATNNNVVTVGTTSSQTISGASTVTVGNQGSGASYSSIDLVSDGSNWRIV